MNLFFNITQKIITGQLYSIQDHLKQIFLKKHI